MLDLLFLAIVAAWSALVGGAILLHFDALPGHRSDRLALACMIGFGAIALCALALAEVGWLDRVGLCVVGLVGVLFAWASSPGRVWARSPGDCEPSDLRGTRLTRVFDLTLGVTLIGTLLTALAPVTDGDALCYHLQVPKLFLIERSMTFDPDLHETVYPLATEMLYAVALAFRGPVACRLVQWALGLGFAGCVTALARPILGPRARWAGTTALLVPAVSNGMAAPLNDVALAAFGNAALLALLLWADRPDARRAALAGIVAGMAIGVKYPALVWVGLLGGAMLAVAVAPARIRDSRFEIREGDDGPSRLESGISNLPSVYVFAAAVLLTGGWWYLRAYIHTGNPVYPFFRHAFGGSGIDDVLDPIKRPMAATIPNLLTALGPMTLDPDRFDSLSHQFGPAFLLLAPGVFLLRPPRRVVAIAALGFTFLTLCLTQRQSMRFVLAAVGPFSVAVAWAASTWWDRRSLPGRLLVVVLVAILAFESLIAVGRARHGLGVAIGREAESAYLRRREPTYRVGLWIDANLSRGARVIGQDHRGFYIPRPYAMELAHRRRTGLAARGESPEEIVARLREDHFTHLLLCPPEPETAVEFDPTLSRRLARWLAARHPLYRESITDPDGVTRLYAVYDLATTSLAETSRARR